MNREEFDNLAKACAYKVWTFERAEEYTIARGAYQMILLMVGHNEEYVPNFDGVAFLDKMQEYKQFFIDEELRKYYLEEWKPSEEE